jgi:aryl-alcohol dehydrogenase-like predicted oxidoreductase
VRQNIIICTKFSHHNGSGEDDFETQHIRGVLEGSLRRLQTDYVDILLLHNPPRQLMDGREATQYEELEKLKAEGKVREYGVSLDWREEVELAVETTNSKALEVFYNALYQEPAPAFPLAAAHGVGLIVKVPLDSGWLSGRYLVARGHRPPSRTGRKVRRAGAIGYDAGAGRAPICVGAPRGVDGHPWREDRRAGARQY